MSEEHAAFGVVAAKALEFVPAGGVIGLGSGRAATAFIHALGERVRAGASIRGVPTSEASAALARQLGIPLATPGEVAEIDVDVDGADEVDAWGNIIKGRGGALVREAIVAGMARQVVILVAEDKLVPTLGSKGVLPVEVVPFGAASCARRLGTLGMPARLRLTGNGGPFVSDNGNHVLDARVPLIERPEELERTIRLIPGVVGTGLFLGLKPTILVQKGNAVEVRRPGTS
jgi:ribose 5-phosphate isomerase A